MIYAIIFCTGIVRAFASPSFNAIVAQIVPRDQLPNAVTLNSSSFLLASVIGHGTAGFLIAHTQYVFTFGIVAVYLCISLYFMFSLADKPTLLNSNEKKQLRVFLKAYDLFLKQRRSSEQWP